MSGTFDRLRVYRFLLRVVGLEPTASRLAGGRSWSRFMGSNRSAELHPQQKLPGWVRNLFIG